MKTFAIACVLSITVPAVAHAADQFDLVCTGYATDKRGAREDYSERFRIDLAGRRWCPKICINVKSLVAIEPGELVLTDRDDRPTGNWVEKHTISRTTGRMVQRIRAGGFIVEREATCEVAPFTDIPAAKF